MGYISILAVAVIITFMAYFGWRGYFQPAKEQGMNVSTYQDVLSNVKTQLNESSQTEADRLRELEHFR